MQQVLQSTFVCMFCNEWTMFSLPPSNHGKSACFTSSLADEPAKPRRHRSSRTTNRPASKCSYTTHRQAAVTPPVVACIQRMYPWMHRIITDAFYWERGHRFSCARYRTVVRVCLISHKNTEADTQEREYVHTRRPATRTTTTRSTLPGAISTSLRKYFGSKLCWPVAS